MGPVVLGRLVGEKEILGVSEGRLDGKMLGLELVGLTVGDEVMEGAAVGAGVGFFVGRGTIW